MDHKEVARTVATRLKHDVGDVVEQVILFGSVARGDAHPESDVDLLVVGVDYRKIHRALVPILGDLLAAGEPIISTIIITPEEYKALSVRNTAFFLELQQEGEPLLA